MNGWMFSFNNELHFSGKHTMQARTVAREHDDAFYSLLSMLSTSGLAHHAVLFAENVSVEHPHKTVMNVI